MLFMLVFLEWKLFQTMSVLITFLIMLFNNFDLPIFDESFKVFMTKCLSIRIVYFIFLPFEHIREADIQWDEIFCFAWAIFCFQCKTVKVLSLLFITVLHQPGRQWPFLYIRRWSRLPMEPKLNSHKEWQSPVQLLFVLSLKRNIKKKFIKSSHALINGLKQ